MIDNESEEKNRPAHHFMENGILKAGKRKEKKGKEIYRIVKIVGRVDTTGEENLS